MHNKFFLYLLVVAALLGLMLVSGCGDLDNTSNDDDQSADFECTTSEYNVGNCNWWRSLNQSQRNHQIITEALYSVDRNIWGQNWRIPCDFWGSYVWGGCYLQGNWDYSNRSNIRGWGGQCKEHARELVQRASGNASNLPSGYDFRGWYPHREKQDAIRYAQAGEVLQLTVSTLHTAVIISNFHDGRFEIVDSNWGWDEKIRKHVINVNQGSLRYAHVRSYVINSCH